MPGHTSPCRARTRRVAAAPGWVRGGAGQPVSRRRGEVDPLERTSRSLGAGAFFMICLG